MQQPNAQGMEPNAQGMEPNSLLGGTQRKAIGPWRTQIETLLAAWTTQVGRFHNAGRSVCNPVRSLCEPKSASLIGEAAGAKGRGMVTENHGGVCSRTRPRFR